MRTGNSSPRKEKKYLATAPYLQVGESRSSHSLFMRYPGNMATAFFVIKGDLFYELVIAYFTLQLNSMLPLCFLILNVNVIILLSSSKVIVLLSSLQTINN